MELIKRGGRLVFRGLKAVGRAAYATLDFALTGPRRPPFNIAWRPIYGRALVILVVVMFVGVAYWAKH
jgi:hypothetical protein